MGELPGGTVTLLFTDIEGSTQLLHALGSQRYADALAAHQRLLREAFAAHGGHEVDAQGDAFFVAFAGAVDAVQAAVAAQRALANHPWPDAVAVRVRMGLHTGEPTGTGGRYVGLAVHRAARVGSAAHGGQVLLSAATEAILCDELPRDFGLRDLGEHRLKDFDRPEHLYQLVAPGLSADFPPPKVADPAPLPPLPVPPATEDTPLVGRERELALLRERLGAALSGRGGLVLLGGEAGVGKTTLAEALGREALARGARVAIGRCYDLTETPPYGPWREGLAAIPAASNVPPLPAGLDPTGRGEAVASQEALLTRAHAYLAAVAARRPLLLLLDDLHWADAASLDLLRFVARQLAGLPVLLLVTYRADELTRRHPLYQLLPLLVREARATQLDLRALPDAAVRELVRARYALGEADERRLVAYVRERAEGHPLFVGELLRTLEAEGVLRLHNGGWSLADLGRLQVPRLLRQVIEGRLDRLDQEDQRLLAMAAVVGQEAPLGLWAAVAEANEGTLLDLLERAQEARLVEPTGEGLRFAHALIREALYEGVLPPRRRGLHRRAAEALLAAARPDPDAVAAHLQRAGDPRAADWLERAAERARGGYAWVVAAARLEAALALREQQGAAAGARGWLLLRLGLLLRLTDLGRAADYLEGAAQLAAEADDPLLAASARFNQGVVRGYLGDDRRALADMEAAVAALDALPPPDARRAAQLRGWGLAADPAHHRGMLALWYANLGHYDRARAMGEQVAARLADVRAPVGLDGAFAPDALKALGLAYAALGRPQEARQALRRSAEGYRAIGGHWQVYTSAWHELLWVVLPYAADDLGERRRLAGEAAQAWARVSGASGGDWQPSLRLPLAVLEGRWAEVDAAPQVAQAPEVLGPLARERGDAALAWAQARARLPAGPATEPGETEYGAPLILQRLAARLACDAGDTTTARRWLEAHDRWLAWSGAVRGRAEGHLGWAHYHRAAGEPPLARQHAARALAHAGEPRQPLALLAAHRLLGELDTAAGHHAEAQGHLAQTLALADACAAPYERALTLLALAELRATTGNRDEARALLDEVRAICAPLDAKPALARADALAAQLDRQVGQEREQAPPRG